MVNMLILGTAAFLWSLTCFDSNDDRSYSVGDFLLPIKLLNRGNRFFCVDFLLQHGQGVTHTFVSVYCG